MDNNDKEKTLGFDVLKTIAEILGEHGKTDEEIREMLEYHFPISSAIMQKILEARKKDK